MARSHIFSLTMLSTDGKCITPSENFRSIEESWEFSHDLSKVKGIQYAFYSIHLVTTIGSNINNRIIRDVPYMFPEEWIGKKIGLLRKLMETNSHNISRWLNNQGPLELVIEENSKEKKREREKSSNHKNNHIDLRLTLSIDQTLWIANALSQAASNIHITGHSNIKKWCDWSKNLANELLDKVDKVMKEGNRPPEKMSLKSGDFPFDSSH